MHIINYMNIDYLSNIRFSTRSSSICKRPIYKELEGRFV